MPHESRIAAQPVAAPSVQPVTVYGAHITGTLTIGMDGLAWRIMLAKYESSVALSGGESSR
ncbi:hypothetical protein [Microbacterium sp. SORGH_AS_0421]|uniref:hypothetical protein n=1 Tax=Microbacterium sp. SORGH_AS_0421 TaxID=3041768 RepID=UPI0027D90A84|nr:hypothetical protein [Microbacterium sp. SORGH_AS_0421]